MILRLLEILQMTGHSLDTITDDNFANRCDFHQTMLSFIQDNVIAPDNVNQRCRFANKINFKKRKNILSTFIFTVDRRRETADNTIACTKDASQTQLPLVM